MLTHQKFVYLQIPHTGNAWVTLALKRIAGDSRLLKHPESTTYSEAPGRIVNRTPFAFVRNPWQWYLVLYATNRFLRKSGIGPFQTDNKQQQDFLNDRFGGSFRQMLDHLENTSESLLHSVVQRYTEKPYETAPDVQLLKFEDGLPDTLLRFLHQLDIQTTPVVENQVRYHQPFHETRVDLTLVDEYFVQWVARHDAAYIQQHGYTPPAGFELTGD